MKQIPCKTTCSTSTCQLPRLPRRNFLTAPQFGRRLTRGVETHSTRVELPPLLDINEDFDARHTFSDYSNWLVPGYIMVGEYPYINGSTCKEHTDGENRLKQVLGSGITTFAAVLEELPSQQEMPIGGVKTFIPYKPTADLIAASLSGPPPSEVVEGLRNPYLDKFIPPRRKEASQAYQNYKPLMPAYHYLPLVPDMEKNNSEDIIMFISGLHEELLSGGKVYIHCTGGTGRAGVVAALLLRRAYGMDPEEALLRVQRTRNLRGDREADGSFIESPHNVRQKNFVRSLSM